MGEEDLERRTFDRFFETSSGSVGLRVEK